MAGQQQNASANPNRLRNRVRHEQHRELRIVPQPQQFFLQIDECKDKRRVGYVGV
jgi:hypothetical protein